MMLAFQIINAILFSIIGGLSALSFVTFFAPSPEDARKLRPAKAYAWLCVYTVAVLVNAFYFGKVAFFGSTAYLTW